MPTASSLEQFSGIVARAARIEGFLEPIQLAIWDAFLADQEASSVPGHLMEIGVYKGKSASILAHHQRPGDQLWLVDYSDHLDDARRNLASIARYEVRYVKVPSVALHREPALADLRRTFRWIHVDGEHTGQAVSSDLAVAHELLADQGLVCLDDFFNPAYPQITAAAMAFLQAHRFELVLVACGFNKGFLARPAHARYVSGLIRTALAGELHARGFSEFTLFKTAPAADYDCWGLGPRFAGRDYYGLDSDPDDLP